jgi:hypothetical protein
MRADAESCGHDRDCAMAGAVHEWIGPTARDSVALGECLKSAKIVCAGLAAG